MINPPKFVREQNNINKTFAGLSRDFLKILRMCFYRIRNGPPQNTQTLLSTHPVPALCPKFIYVHIANPFSPYSIQERPEPQICPKFIPTSICSKHLHNTLNNNSNSVPSRILKFWVSFRPTFPSVRNLCIFVLYDLLKTD